MADGSRRERAGARCRATDQGECWAGLEYREQTGVGCRELRERRGVGCRELRERTGVGCRKLRERA